MSVGGVPEPVPSRSTTATTAPAGLSELGARVRADWRTDEEQWTSIAAQRWAHGRRITDLLREHAARGDRIALDVAGRTFEGAVHAVGDDRVDVATAATVVTVHLALSDAWRAVLAPVTVRRTSRARSGGRRLALTRATFRARLHELEGMVTPARVGVFAPQAEYVGSLTVGADHVLVDGPDGVVVPAAWIAYVASAVDGDR